MIVIIHPYRIRSIDTLLIGSYKGSSSSVCVEGRVISKKSDGVSVLL